MVLLHAHSGIRYLVILMGIISAVYYFYAIIRNEKFNRTSKALGLIFTISLDIQALVGIILFISRGFQYYLIEHISVMLMALISAHLFSILNKKRKDPGFKLALAAVVVPLLLIWLGISLLPY